MYVCIYTCICYISTHILRTNKTCINSEVINRRRKTTIRGATCIHTYIHTSSCILYAHAASNKRRCTRHEASRASRRICCRRICCRRICSISFVPSVAPHRNIYVRKYTYLMYTLNPTSEGAQYSKPHESAAVFAPYIIPVTFIHLNDTSTGTVLSQTAMSVPRTTITVAGMYSPLDSPRCMILYRVAAFPVHIDGYMYVSVYICSFL
jgi:hypothetical protein